MPPCYSHIMEMNTIITVYVMHLQFSVFLVSCISVPVIPSLLSFALEIVGVSILIQLEASIANNSWQSQTLSLINVRDRGSRLPSSPVLIAVIESPLTQEHQSHILSLCGLLLPYTTDR